jgi:hypothetical protein
MHPRACSSAWRRSLASRHPGSRSCKQGEDQFEAHEAKAAAISASSSTSDTIAKAQPVQRAMENRVAAWDLQFKASLASILPLLVQMATLAGKIIDGARRGRRARSGAG